MATIDAGAWAKQSVTAFHSAIPSVSSGFVSDKNFKGAKPGNLPVEQPTTFELFVNQKTAKALRIKVPQTILIQATRVIE